MADSLNTGLARAFQGVVQAAFAMSVRDAMLKSLIEMTVAEIAAMTPEQLRAKADESLLHSKMMGNA